MTYQSSSVANEIWKVVPSLGSQYFASNLGRVKSVRQFKGGTKEKILGSLSKSTGYFVINISVDGKRLPVTVHSLVAETFLGPRPKGLVVNHINHIRTDNRIENLEYITQKENVLAAIKAGRSTTYPRTAEYKQRMSAAKRGIPCKLRPLTKSQADLIRKEKAFSTCIELAKKYGVSKKAIQNIINNRTYLK